MSIYRGFRPLPSDVHVRDVGPKPLARDHLHADAGAPPVHQRRAQPVLVLLPRTARWVAEIPPRFRPVALARDFPRIANSICACWADPPARGEYLGELISGGRPNRQGFPPPVLREIQTLLAVHVALQSRAATTWEALHCVWDGSQRLVEQDLSR